MFFFIASTIIGLAASAVTIKILVGYATLKWWLKLIIAALILFGWFGHSAMWSLRHHDMLSPLAYKIYAYAAYIGLGFCFILLALLLARDCLWLLSYGVGKLAHLSWFVRFSPFNDAYVNVANAFTVLLAITLTGWGVFEGVKSPAIKEITISDSKIKEPFKIVQINDLHINRTTSVEKIERLVAKVDTLDADIIALVGDLADELPARIMPQMTALSKLKAKYGIFTVFGNHDFYAGVIPWLKAFKELNLGPLFNNGMEVNGNIYIAGIPDKSIDASGLFGKIDIKRAFADNKDNLYAVLLSHSPLFSEEPLSGFDLQLSGHTHGGQIFPFHFLVKSANKYLAGLYQEDGYKVYVSRGAGYWGPPMRLFAPSDITVINLRPQE